MEKFKLFSGASLIKYNYSKTPTLKKIVSVSQSKPKVYHRNPRYYWTSKNFLLGIIIGKTT